MIYITSDTHFFHKNVIRYDDRPFENIQHMNEIIINNWNEMVREDDLVIHLGDFIFAGGNRLEEIVNRLNGYKILLKGNHDRKSNNYFIKRGFFHCEYNMIIDDIMLGHYPIYEIPPEKSNKQSSIYNKYIDKIKRNNIKNIVHGHIHNNLTSLDNSYNQFNVSCCVHDYKPIKFETIKQFFSEKS